MNNNNNTGNNTNNNKTIPSAPPSLNNPELAIPFLSPKSSTHAPEYWVSIQYDTFTKKDLRTGQWVMTREGDYYIALAMTSDCVTVDNFVFTRKNDTISLDNYTEDLHYISPHSDFIADELDIVAVLEPIASTPENSMSFIGSDFAKSEEYTVVVWEREDEDDYCEIETDTDDDIEPACICVSSWSKPSQADIDLAHAFHILGYNYFTQDERTGVQTAFKIKPRKQTHEVIGVYWDVADEEWDVDPKLAIDLSEVTDKRFECISPSDEQPYSPPIHPSLL